METATRRRACSSPSGCRAAGRETPVVARRRHGLLVLAVLASVLALASANDRCGAPCELFCQTAETVSEPRTDCFAYFDSQTRPCSTCEAATANTTHCIYEVDNFGTSSAPVMRLLGSQAASTSFTTRFNQDRMYVSWNEPIKYQHPTASTPNQVTGEVDNFFTFPGANDPATCLSLWTETPFEEDTTDIEACFNLREISANWASLDVVGANPCGLVRSIAPDFVSFALETRLNYVEILDDTRDTVGLHRTLGFSMPVDIRFPTQINVTATFRAFSPIFLQTVILAQSQFFVNGDPTNELNSRMSVRFLTSVQAPFDVFVSAVDDGVVSTPGNISVVPSGINGLLRVAGQPECLDDAPCEEQWVMEFQPDLTSVCSFTGTYQVNMSVTCSPPGPGSDGPYLNETTGEPLPLCPVDDNTDDLVIVFELASSNYCPEVVSNIELSASAATYVNECVDPEQDVCTTKLGFLHSQVLYFTAQVWSDEASIQRTLFRRCDLSKSIGASTESMQLYDRDFLNATGHDVGFYNFKPTNGLPSAYGDRSFPRFEFIVDTVDDVAGDGFGSTYDPNSETSVTASVITIPDPDLSPVSPRPNIFKLPADGNVAIDITCIIDVEFQFAGARQSVDVDDGSVSLQRRSQQVLVSSSSRVTTSGGRIVSTQQQQQQHADAAGTEVGQPSFRQLDLVDSNGQVLQSAMNLFEDRAIVQTRFSAIGPTTTTTVTTGAATSSALPATVLVYVGVTLVAVVSLSGLALVLSRERKRRSQEEEQLRALYGDAYVDSLQRSRTDVKRSGSVSEQDLRDVSYSESCSSSVIGGVTVYV